MTVAFDFPYPIYGHVANCSPARKRRAKQKVAKSVLWKTAIEA